MNVIEYFKSIFMNLKISDYLILVWKDSLKADICYSRNIYIIIIIIKPN